MKKESAVTLGLSMIVKDEAKVIKRCLDSVRPFISHWVIVDTGSTDGTQDLIREYMNGIPGTLYERPWKDFAHNRSEALSLARAHADFSLIIDADDVFEVPGDFVMPGLDVHSCTVNIVDGSIVYPRRQLVNNKYNWIYRGVLHEFLWCLDAQTESHLPVNIIRNHDGARRKDPSCFNRDVEVLSSALRSEPDQFLRERYTFYLAQSHRDAGDKQEAIKFYLQRAEMGGWKEEVYYSLFQAGLLKEQLNEPADQVIALYHRATAVLPDRLEARYAASRLHRVRKEFAQGYDCAKNNLGKRLPPGTLFGNQWIYDVGLLDEFSVNAYWIGKYDESLDACLKLLREDKLAPEDRKRVTSNAYWSWEKISDALGRTRAR